MVKIRKSLLGKRPEPDTDDVDKIDLENKKLTVVPPCTCFDKESISGSSKEESGIFFPNFFSKKWCTFFFQFKQ